MCSAGNSGWSGREEVWKSGSRYRGDCFDRFKVLTLVKEWKVWKEEKDSLVVAIPAYLAPKQKSKVVVVENVELYNSKS